MMKEPEMKEILKELAELNEPRMMNPGGIGEEDNENASKWTHEKNWSTNQLF